VEKITGLHEERDLGVVILDKLAELSFALITTIHVVNKLLGLLEMSCPLLTKVVLTRSLYLAVVKLYLCCTTEVWSPTLMSLKL